jgi:hypothetical protein
MSRGVPRHPTFTAEYTLDFGETGVWSFWPAYREPDGTYGPYEWHEHEINVQD